MNAKHLIYITLILLTGCDNKQQTELSNPTAHLTKTEAACVSDYKDFLYSTYVAELNNRSEALKGKNIAKTIEATESLLKTHKSINLTGCPVELVSMVDESRGSLQDMLNLMYLQRDNPSTAMEHLSALHASGQALQITTKQTVDYIKSVHSD